MIPALSGTAHQAGHHKPGIVESLADVAAGCEQYPLLIFGDGRQVLRNRAEVVAAHTAAQ
jgi:hypothetical protein